MSLNEELAKIHNKEISLPEIMEELLKLRDQMEEFLKRKKDNDKQSE